MTKNTGGPAFPLKEPMSNDFQGMTLRDYFAAKALQGMLAYPDEEATYDNCACWAYQYADAMLEERGESK